MAIMGKKHPEYFIIQPINFKKYFFINSLSFSSEIKSVQLALKYPPNPVLYLTWLLAD